MPRINQRFCFHCRLVLPDREQLIAMNRVGLVDPVILEEICGSVVDWWRTIGKSFTDRDHLLPELLWIGDGAEKGANYRHFQLGQAIQVAGELNPSWELSVSPEPVRHSVVQAIWVPSDPAEPRSIDRQPRIQDHVGRCYRSLRKHLYKTYVRGHAHCYRQLKGLHRHESLALNGDKLCRPGLAFLIWRMSIEGVTQIEALRWHRQDNFPLRLMGPSRFYDLPLSASLRWCYFGFFGIWHQLETHRSTLNSKFRVAMSSERCEGHVHWKCTAETSARDIDGSETIRGRFAILYPDLTARIDANRADCRMRRIHGNSMLAHGYADPDYDWSGLLEEFSVRNCLFQVRFPERVLINRLFTYINV
jgi:hypothetical protein